MSAVCLVFAKPPVPGRAKTRLAPALGPDGAARVAAALLRDTIGAIASVPGVELVLATPEPGVDHGVGPIVAWDQGGGDLGDRLERTLRRALARWDVALAIGADAPHVPHGALGAALRALAEHDAVLGPTDDGGFHLLGLRRCPDGLLADLPWSTAATFRATRARLAERGLSVGLVEDAWDVDLPQDLARLRAEVPRAYAPSTHAALDALEQAIGTPWWSGSSSR